jgi:membrane-bound lytic murein transglycosylase D
MAKAKAQHGKDIGRVVKDYNGPAFGFASRNFYSEFMAAREVARNAKRYFPEGVNYEQPWPHDRLVLSSSMPAHHVANHYGVSTGSLASLNLHWRDSARDGRAALPAGSTVWLPAGSMRRVAGQPSASGGSAMLARNEPQAERPSVTRNEPLSEPRIEAQPEYRPRPEPVLASNEPAEREPALEIEPSPEPVRSSWGGGGGIISSANAGELPPRRPKAERPMIVVPSASEPKSEPVAAKLPESKPKSEPKSTKLAQSKPKTAPKDTKATQAKGKPDAKDAKLAKSGKAEVKGGKVAKAEAKPESKSRSGKAQTKFHVVKPQETLYRVATLNGISVAELRRLNKMGPKDNSIRPGQKLKVDI